MGNLYETISSLCESKGIKGAKLCNDIGISKGLLTDLKMGRRTGVSAVTAQKIATYFGVSVGYLLGEEEFLQTSQHAYKSNNLKNSMLFTEQEMQLIQRYRNNPRMKSAIDALLVLETEHADTASELPVAARSGKIGKVTPTASVEEQDAALESEFPGIFDETE